MFTVANSSTNTTVDLNQSEFLFCKCLNNENDSLDFNYFLFCSEILIDSK